MWHRGSVAWAVLLLAPGDDGPPVRADHRFQCHVLVPCIWCIRGPCYTLLSIDYLSLSFLGYKFLPYRQEVWCAAVAGP